jgi:hypothetical protein
LHNDSHSGKGGWGLYGYFRGRSRKYARLNHIVGVGRRTVKGIAYSVHEVL